MKPRPPEYVRVVDDVPSPVCRGILIALAIEFVVFGAIALWLWS
jgi:hypothetical protein